MKVFYILVSLLWNLPAPSNEPSFQITHLNGKPLFFTSKEACLKHVGKNRRYIKMFVDSYYEGKAVSNRIACDSFEFTPVSLSEEKHERQI